MPRSTSFGVGALVALVLGLPSAAHGQLRPLDPLDWRVVGFEGHAIVMGAGFYSGQRASLAGTEGVLFELAAFRATWGLGRMAVEFAGTALRLFDERSTFAAPAPDVLPADGRRRRDVGDYRVTTIVQLTPPDAERALALRFGVRLPTTDNLQGLDRDQTDFFSLLAGRIEGERWQVGGELGLGIFGTRDTRNEQVDPLLFGLSARYDIGPVRGLLELAGHHDTRAGPDRRGNEDLGEARLGMEAGGDRWVQVALIRGWTPSSPDLGVTITLGTRF